MRGFVFSLALGLALVVPTPAFAEGFYLSTFGGGNWKEAYTSDGGDSTVVVSPDVGYVAGAALGSSLSFLPGTRAEVELSFRSNNLAGYFDGCSDFDLTGHDSTFAAMANLAYDLPGAWGLKPYVLAGAGYAARRINFEPSPDNWSAGYGTERQGFAWQAGAGVNYQVSEDVQLGLGYRYFEGVSINRVVEYGKNEAFLEANGTNHAAILSLTLLLD